MMRLPWVTNRNCSELVGNPAAKPSFPPTTRHSRLIPSFPPHPVIPASSRHSRESGNPEIPCTGNVEQGKDFLDTGQGLSVFNNRIPSFPLSREPRASLRHETLDSGFRRNDEILEILENRKTLGYLPRV